MGSSVPSQAGVLGVALQASKIGSGTFDPDAVDWIRFKAPSVTFDIIQGDQIFPPEVGGAIVPTGAYKDSMFPAGTFDVIPRLERSFPLLLKAVMGNASSVTGVLLSGAAQAGANAHILNFNPSSSYSIPWMAFRRSLPGATASDWYGQSAYDCKIASLRLTIPAAGKLAARFTMVGRDVLQEEEPNWTWDNTYEDHQSSPDAGRGHFKIGGTEYPVTGAVIDFNNSLTTPQQEMIIGDFHPDDFVPLFRSMTVRFVYKWDNPTLYQRIFNGAPDSEAWSSLPFLQDTSGANQAFEVTFQSPGYITGSVPYELRARVNRITFAPDGPIELRGGQILQQAFVGTVLEPTSGDYAQFLVLNGSTTVE